jgi:hypothetical protein
MWQSPVCVKDTYLSYLLYTRNIYLSRAYLLPKGPATKIRPISNQNLMNDSNFDASNEHTVI